MIHQPATQEPTQSLFERLTSGLGHDVRTAGGASYTGAGGRGPGQPLGDGSMDNLWTIYG